MLRVVLACIALLGGCVGVHAQGRGPSVKELQERTAVDPEVARTARLAEVDAWLRRMTGRFRSGQGQYRTVTDCAGIGTGAGVHCVRSAREGAPTLTMYGIDPEVPGIRYLQVDGRSIAEGDVGKLSGDTVTFGRVQCPTSVDRRAVIYTTVCERQL